MFETPTFSPTHPPTHTHTHAHTHTTTPHHTIVYFYLFLLFMLSIFMMRGKRQRCMSAFLLYPYLAKERFRFDVKRIELEQ